MNIETIREHIKLAERSNYIVPKQDYINDVLELLSAIRKLEIRLGNIEKREEQSKEILRMVIGNIPLMCARCGSSAVIINVPAVE